MQHSDDVSKSSGVLGPTRVSSSSPMPVVEWLNRMNKKQNNGGRPSEVDADHSWLDSVRIDCPLPPSIADCRDSAATHHHYQRFAEGLSAAEISMAIGTSVMRRIYRLDTKCPKGKVETKHTGVSVAAPTTGATSEKETMKKSADIMAEFSGFIDVDEADEDAVSSHVAGIGGVSSSSLPSYDPMATCATGNCCSVPSCLCGIRLVKSSTPQSISAFVRRYLNRVGATTEGKDAGVVGPPQKPVPSALEAAISKSVLHARYRNHSGSNDNDNSSSRAAIESALSFVVQQAADPSRCRVDHRRLIGDVPHTGLRNIRNTCYMNSVLQMIYHIPEVRQSIILASSVPASELADLGLGSLFATMMYGAVEAVDTYAFAVEGLHINPREQQDAQEFLGLLLQLLASVAPPPSRVLEAANEGLAAGRNDAGKLVELSNLQGVLQRAFESSLVYQRVCSSCGSSKFRADTAPFHTVPLVRDASSDEAVARLLRKGGASSSQVAEVADDAADPTVEGTSAGMSAPQPSAVESDDMSAFFDNFNVQGTAAANTSTTLESSLLDMLSPGTIDGYSCEDCGANYSCNNVAVTRMSMKKMPEYLVLHLGRFQYNLQSGDRIKLNTSLDFPNYLDMGKVMNEGNDAFNAIVRSMVGEAATRTSATEPCWYQLEGIVNHHGTTPKSGHYTYSTRCHRRKEANNNSTGSSDDEIDANKLLRETMVVGGCGEEGGDEAGVMPTEPVWVHCDDSTISDLSTRSFGAQQERYNSKNAYLLVYRRTAAPLPPSTTTTTANAAERDIIEVDTPAPEDAGAKSNAKAAKKSAKQSTAEEEVEEISGDDDDDCVEVQHSANAPTSVDEITVLRRKASEALIGALSECTANWETYLPVLVRNQILGGAAADGDRSTLNPDALNPSLYRVYTQYTTLKKHLTNVVANEWLPMADVVFGAKKMKKGAATKKSKAATTANTTAVAEGELKKTHATVATTVATTRSGRPIRGGGAENNPASSSSDGDDDAVPLVVDAASGEREEQVVVPSAWLKLFGGVFADRVQAARLLLPSSPHRDGDVDSRKPISLPDAVSSNTSPPARSKGRRVATSERDSSPSTPPAALSPPLKAQGATSASSPSSSSVNTFGFSGWSATNKLREAGLARAFSPTTGAVVEGALPFSMSRDYGACLSLKSVPDLLADATHAGAGFLCPHGLLRPPSALVVDELEGSPRSSVTHNSANHAAACHYKLISKSAAKAIRDWCAPPSSQALSFSALSLKSTGSDFPMLPLTDHNGLCRRCVAVEVLMKKARWEAEKRERAYKEACEHLQLLVKNCANAAQAEHDGGGAAADRTLSQMAGPLGALREIAWVPSPFLDWWLSQPYDRATPAEAAKALRKSKKKAPTAPTTASGSKITHKSKKRGTVAAEATSVMRIDEDTSDSVAVDGAPESYDLTRPLLCKCYFSAAMAEGDATCTVAPLASCAPIPREVLEYLVRSRGFEATVPIITSSQGMLQDGSTPANVAAALSLFVTPPRCAECVRVSMQGTQREVRVRTEKYDQLKRISGAARVTAPAKAQQQREADCAFDRIQAGSAACMDPQNALEVGAVPHLQWLSLLCPVVPQLGINLEGTDISEAPASTASGSAPAAASSPSTAPLSIISREINKQICKKNLSTAVKAFSKAWARDQEAAQKLAAEQAQKKTTLDAMFAAKGGGSGGGGRVLKLGGHNTPTTPTSPVTHIDVDADLATSIAEPAAAVRPPYLGTTYAAIPLPWAAVWHAWARQPDATLPATIHPPNALNASEAAEPSEGGLSTLAEVIAQAQVAERARQAALFRSSDQTNARNDVEEEDEVTGGTTVEQAAIQRVLLANLAASFEHLQASRHLFCPKHPGRLLLAVDDFNPVKCGYDTTGNTACADECGNNGLFLPGAAQALEAVGTAVKEGGVLTGSGVEAILKTFNDFTNNTAYPPFVLVPLEELPALEACLIRSRGAKDGSSSAAATMDEGVVVVEGDAEDWASTVFERHHPSLLTSLGVAPSSVVPPPNSTRGPTAAFSPGFPLILVQEVETERVILSYPTCTECRDAMLARREAALRSFGIATKVVGVRDNEGGGVAREDGGTGPSPSSAGGGSINVHMKIRKSKKGAFHQSTDVIPNISGQTSMQEVSVLCATVLLEKHGLLVEASQLLFFLSNKNLITAQRGTAKEDKSVAVCEGVTLSSIGVKDQGNLYCLFADGVATSIGGSDSQAAVGASFEKNKKEARAEATFQSTRLGGLGGGTTTTATASSGAAEASGDGGVRECPICTYHNSPLLTTCEMCESPLQ